MDGRRSARDVNGRAAAHADAGILQIDGRLASGNIDLLVECAAHPVIAIVVDCSVILDVGLVDKIHDTYVNNDVICIRQ